MILMQRKPSQNYIMLAGDGRLFAQAIALINVRAMRREV